MKLKDYIEKRGIDSKDLSKRLGITVNTLKKAQLIPARIRTDIMIIIIQGTGGIVTANDLLGLTRVKARYKSIFENPEKPKLKSKKPSSIKLLKKQL